MDSKTVVLFHGLQSTAVTILLLDLRFGHRELRQVGSYVLRTRSYHFFQAMSYLSAPRHSRLVVHFLHPSPRASHTLMPSHPRRLPSDNTVSDDLFAQYYGLLRKREFVTSNHRFDKNHLNHTLSPVLVLKTEINQASVSPARAQGQMGSQQSGGRARCRPGGTEEDGRRIPGEIQDNYLQADSEQSAEPDMGLHPTTSRS